MRDRVECVLVAPNVGCLGAIGNLEFGRCTDRVLEFSITTVSCARRGLGLTHVFSFLAGPSSVHFGPAGFVVDAGTILPVAESAS